MFGNLIPDFVITSFTIWILGIEDTLSPLAIAKSVEVQVLCLLLIALIIWGLTHDKSLSGFAFTLNEKITDINNIILNIFSPFFWDIFL